MYVGTKKTSSWQGLILVATTAVGTVAGTHQARGATYLLEQPSLPGIAGNLFVAHATTAGLPVGVFDLVLWQKNPNRADGLLIPTTWDAGSQTGFTPASPATSQLGFQNKPGTSTAQFSDNVVGAYINSRDLPAPASKMMIAAHYTFPQGSLPVPFASSTSSLNSSMDLQVPTAVGKSYVVADFTLKSPNGLIISYGVTLFANGHTRNTVGSGYNAPSASYMVNSPLASRQQFVMQAGGSASASGIPWLGWRTFSWTISSEQFVSALKYLAEQFPNKNFTLDPTRYVLQQVHLNAEIQIDRANPSELGWSMRNWKIWLP